MTDKQIAERLREMEENGDWSDVQALADELDSPQPKQGLIVFENGTYGFVLRGHMSVDHKWDIVTDFGELLTFDDALPFKPARILAPDEVAVKIPPVSEWENDWMTLPPLLITREKAERMEAEG